MGVCKLDRPSDRLAYYM